MTAAPRAPCTMATELSADTRARILETAWQLARRGGTGAVSVKEVAAAAKVSRQLVYFHYGHRAGLLLAMARHHDHTSGFIERVVETRELPANESLEALVRLWCNYVPDILPVARALEAALITGDEGSAAWRDRMDDLWRALRIPLERIQAQDGLADGWTLDRATDWLWAQVQPANYEYLVAVRGWTSSQFAERAASAAAEVTSGGGR
jgi:AcrR family transcriptional regulator